MTHIADLAPVSYPTFRGPSTLRLRVMGALLMTLAAFCVARTAFLVVMDPPIPCYGLCGCRAAPPRPDTATPAVVACLKPPTYR